MLRATRRSALATAIVLAITATSGCGRDQQAGTQARSEPATITYLPGFGILGQDAYIYLAIEKGYFADAGLTVEVQPGKGTNENLAVLLAGKATFATVDMAGATIVAGKALTGGQPALADFRVISSVYARSVSTITALEDSGIRDPKDLAGKTIGYQPGGVNHTLFPGYARIAGIDTSKIKWQVVSPPQLRPLLGAGRLDAITETVIGTPGVETAAKGRKAVVLPYSDVLTDLYGNVLVASTHTINTDLDLVRGFRQAALRGLVYAIDHPDEAGQIFHKHQNAYPAEVAAAETALMAGYVRADGVDRIGALDPGRVARSIALLQSLGAVPAGIYPDQVVDFDAATAYQPE